jgi:hypothetical protein
VLVAEATLSSRQVGLRARGNKDGEDANAERSGTVTPVTVEPGQSIGSATL